MRYFKMQGLPSTPFAALAYDHHENGSVIWPFLSPFKEGVCKIPFSSKLELGFLVRGQAIFNVKSSSPKLSTKKKKIELKLGFDFGIFPLCNHLVLA
jgi:hypothetical protein